MSDRDHAEPGWVPRVRRVYDGQMRVETVPGAVVVAEDDAATDVRVLEADGGVRVLLPPGLDQVRRALRDDGARPLEPGWWATALGEPPTRVVGPSVHAYTDAVPDVAIVPEVEQVAPWRLTRLERAVTPEEWDGSGLGGEVDLVFGRFSEPLDPPEWMVRATPAARRTEISAAACVTAWDGTPSEVGVVVHPDFRRRGHGLEVATPAVEHVVRTTGIARWRADELNTGSRSIAARLGLTPWARHLVVEP